MNLFLILAGYSREMDYFLSLNPGLLSRFPLVIDFPDYTTDQLMEIAVLMLEEREYVMSRDAESKLRQHLIILRSVQSPISFSNGRYIRNVIEKAIRAQAMRLLHEDSYEKMDLMTLRSQDFHFSEEEESSVKQNGVEPFCLLFIRKFNFTNLMYLGIDFYHEGI